MPRGFKTNLNNPALIAWAIETAGFTPQEIADFFKKPIAIVNAWISGEDSPTYHELERLANRVKRPLAAFYLPKPPEEPPLPTDFRSLSNMPKGRYRPATRFAFRRARQALQNARDLFEEMGEHTVFSLPAFGLASDPEEEAKRLREAWDVSLQTQIHGCHDERQAFDMWRSVLFDYGVLAMVFPIPLEDARGFCLLDSDLAAIGVSSKDAPATRISSLIHEVCHLCLRQPGVSTEVDPAPGKRAASESDIERFCDRFAAALLLPGNAPEVRQVLEQVSRNTAPHEVARSARPFKVSKWVLLRRSLDLGYVSEPLFWNVWNAWKQEDGQSANAVGSGGGDYVVNTVSHIGKRLTGLVFEALDTKHISLYEASQILSLDPKHFSKARVFACA